MNISKNSILPEQIIYEDNHILVINKYPSEIVQGDKTGDLPLSEKIKNFIKQRDKKPGNVFCGVVHRLDRPVSGLVLFAKTSKGLSRFSELFRARDTEKKYLAVVKNKPPKTSDRISHYLLKNEKNNTSKAHVKEVPGSKLSTLEYELIASSENYHLLKINLLTGRHHQIRAQLAAIGCPIKGDLKYGFPRSNPGPYIHLHSYSLAFLHPVKKETINIQCWPLYDDPIWNHFHSVIQN